MALFMAAAVTWSVLQLALVSWPARSVRLATLLLLVPVGVYGCGTVAAGLQLIWTHGFAAATGQTVHQVTATTSYTAGPVIEELVKVAPLLLIVGVGVRSRLQRGLTDYVVAGAATGAGFSLLEGMLRFAGSAANAQPIEGGWVLPTGFYPPFISGPGTIVTSWLPAPVGVWDLTGVGSAPGIDLHVAFTALAALGVGIALRGSRWWRLAGLLPFALATGDHILYNYVIVVPGTAIQPMMDGPVAAARWAVPVVALLVAMLLDVRVLRRVKATHPDVLTAVERTRPTAPLWSVVTLARYAMLRPRYTALIALRYTRMRRAACYAFDATPARRGPVEVGPLVDATRQVTPEVDGSSTRAAWRGVSRADARRALASATPVATTPGAGTPGGIAPATAEAPRSASGIRNRRLILLVLGVAVPLILALPALLYFVAGGFPSTADLQEAMLAPAGFTVMLVAGGMAAMFLVWRLVTSVRFARAQRGHPVGEILATARLRVALAAGSTVAIAAVTIRVLTESDPRASLITTYFLLDAMLSAILGAALMLSLLALVTQLGGLGLGFALVGGGTASVAAAMTLAAAARAAGLGALAGALLTIAQAGGLQPRMPQLPPKAPRLRPSVNSRSLDNLLRDLWKWPGRPNRVGDGTTMDALKSEILTGKMTKDRGHYKKVYDMHRALNKWLRRNRHSASPNDIEVATAIRNELRGLLKWANSVKP